MKKVKIYIGSIILISSFAQAQTEEKQESVKNVEEVTIIGSRSGQRTKTESPVPVDVFDLKKASSSLPQVNINQILNSIAPSFTSTPQVVADGADHSDPAQLRGLGPDQTLVLLNGKRRHTSAFINVNGTPGRGTVGTDLNAIPAFALSRIEILRDGASAQYGSDAISGVMNLQLKRDKKFSGQVSYGANVTHTANDHTGGIDGQLAQIDLNYGLGLGKKGGFLNLTYSGQYRQPTYRAGAFDGTIFNAYNAIERRALEDGVNLSSHFGNINTIALPNDFVQLIQKYAQNVSYFDASLQSDIQSATSISTLQNLLKVDVTDNELMYRGFTRKDYNMKVGQSQLKSSQLFFNTEISISDNWKVYGFGGYSYRNGNAGGFFRRPNQSRTFTGLYPNGFLPEITTDIQDFSVSAGVDGRLGSWKINLSNTFGLNKFAYTVENTSNTSLRFASPTKFDAGALEFIQNTVNLDISKSVNLFRKSNISFGAEQRHETFSIGAGEETSYTSYGQNTDFFGRSLPGGSQVFNGFRKESSLTKHRDVYAVYGEFETDFNRWLMAQAAVRFENYSDFGSTFNYKLASRAKLTSNLNIRAAASTGFRAPSIHQIYYTNTGTVYLNGQLNETGTFNNVSKAAELFGIEKLREEKSKSISAGLTYRIPKAGLTFTTDAYFIRVDDRIVLTESFSRPKNPTTTAQLELQRIFDTANVTSAQFFANAINAETKGIDVVVSHQIKKGNWSLSNDLGLNITQTRKVGEIHTPATIKANNLDKSFFSERARVYLEEAVPRTKASLSHQLEVGKWSLYVRNTYYGKTTAPDIIDANLDGKIAPNEHQIISSKIVTDLSTAYEFNKSIKLTLGVNNLFDKYPDKNIVGNTNNGQFIYSRSTSQFGLNGRYIFAKVNFQF